EDYLQLAELMCIDAYHRDESCGAHFRIEHQTERGEAKRRDAMWATISAWSPGSVPHEFICHSEPLEFQAVELNVRDYR
ncbi:MAG: fumarate reductase/succinate dehydrogenase flavoprotein subunit, partial [Bowdeniella nasicola]|nr:fumarate reductase/succinate dehydrogenase flavoprotein subunit [Bowdeniella nasicola]